MHTGYIIDSPDPRDFAVDEAVLGLAAAPSSFSHKTKVKAVLDQRSSNSCVANTVMQSARMLKGGELGSRLFTYFNSRLPRGNQLADIGTTFRDCFRGMEKFGYCYEASWPFDLNNKNVMPNRTAYHRAFPAREGEVDRTTYKRILETGDDRKAVVQRIIANGYTVCFGTQVDKEFSSGAFDPTSPKGIPTGTLSGGHAMLFVGYNPSGLIVLNSWGTNWGDAGYFLMSYDWLAWSKLTDLWVIEKCPKPEGA
jgi:C1A family cysteine protease